MKKILFITAFPPSELAAAEKNTKLMLRDLGKQYEVDLVYFKDDDVAEYTPELPNIHVKELVRNSKYYRLKNVALYPLCHPIFTVRFNWRLRRKLQRVINENNYVAIIFDHSQTFMYAKWLSFVGPKVLLSHDVEAQRFERTSNRFMTWLCRKSERYVFSTKNVHVYTFCQKDVDLIKEYYNIEAHLCLDYIDDRIIDSKPGEIQDRFVLFGNWVRPDNYEGALWLLNGLGEYLKFPIKVCIIGKKFPIEKVIKHEKVDIDYLDFVDNPYPLIAESKAMLCPLFSGAGIKVKVIESLASGTPVIGTEIAFEGFDNSFDSYMLRCQDYHSFSKAIEYINFPLNERLAFKSMFISSYRSKTIPAYLSDMI